MSRRIAILGASGAVGSALAVHILRSRLLEPADRLLLVGHGVPTSERKLLGARIDLLDAFDEERVGIEIVPDIEEVKADIVVVTSGATISAACPTRHELGAANRVLFEHVADQCARHLPEALFLVVSNPVELAVHILASRVDRCRVFGMGAQQDSLRFARAIANDLGISRHEVRASVLGEHGQEMAPLWGSVELQTQDDVALQKLESLIARSREKPLAIRVAELRSEIRLMIADELISEAYEATQRALPDARIFVEPFITLHTMHSTPNATANATLQCLSAVLANDRRQIYAQVMLKGEISGMPTGVCGVPVTVGKAGWRAEPLDWLTPEERTTVTNCAQAISAFVDGVMTQPLESPIPLVATLLHQ